MKKALLIIFSFLVMSGLITTVVLVEGNFHEIGADKMETADVFINGIQLNDADTSDYFAVELEGLPFSKQLQELDQWAWQAQGGEIISPGNRWTVEIVYHQKSGKELIRRYHGSDESPAGKKYFATLYLKAQELYMAEKDKQVNEHPDYYPDDFNTYDSDWTEDWYS